MLHFDVLTIFPEVFGPYINEAMLNRAQKKRLVKIGVHNLRKWAKDKHKTVDDRPFGGGAGMVMKVEPIYKAVTVLKKVSGQRSNAKSKVILFAAKGKQFDQRMAERYAKLKHIIFICGRYEGVDERVAKYIADEEVSIGPYVLTGGELPAMTVIDAVTRLIPGVLGNKESLKEESFSKVALRQAQGAGFGSRSQEFAGQIREYPHYTRPEVFSLGGKKKWRVPKVLLSGNHNNIVKWRSSHQTHR